MGRLREAVLANSRKPGPLCKVAVLRQQLTPEDVAEFDELLRDAGVYTTTLCEQVRVIHGVDINPETMRRHRLAVTGKGVGCQCLRV